MARGNVFLPPTGVLTIDCASFPSLRAARSVAVLTAASAPTDDAATHVATRNVRIERQIWRGDMVVNAAGNPALLSNITFCTNQSVAGKSSVHNAGGLVIQSSCVNGAEK